MTTAAKQIIRSLSSESPVTKRRIVSLQDGIEEEKVGLMASEDTQEEEEEDIQTTTEENTTIAAVSENDDEEHQPLTAVGIDEETAEDPAEPSTDTNGTDSAKPSKKIEPMEIALNDEDDEDLEALLGDSKRQLQQKQQQSRSCCSTCCCCCCCCCGGGSQQRIGNSRVVCPWLYQRTGWGLVGVHWFGPLCVSLVMAWASEYFIRRAWIRIGPISASICIGFTAMSFWLLINTAYRDPGFCVKGDEPDPQKDDLSQWRWCDLCETYQPPDGAHCPDCNVCVAGYDHHCVWMGTCIGKKNHKQFVRFNLCWLLYLIYAIAWVAILGPIIFRKHHASP